MQGGGDVNFELKCSGLLQVFPPSGKMKDWIKPVSLQVSDQSASFDPST
jgi:hypothetical protein